MPLAAPHAPGVAPTPLPTITLSCACSPHGNFVKYRRRRCWRSRQLRTTQSSLPMSNQMPVAFVLNKLAALNHRAASCTQFVAARFPAARETLTTLLSRTTQSVISSLCARLAPKPNWPIVLKRAAAHFDILAFERGAARDSPVRKHNLRSSRSRR